MEPSSRRGRPDTGSSLSRNQRRDRSNENDDNIDAGANHPTPVRPSRERATSSTPRVVAEATRRHPGSEDNHITEKVPSELEYLRAKLEETDFAKAQAQVQVQKQGAKIVKLERYVGQLVDELGGVDAGVLENIVQDLEKDSRVNSALAQNGPSPASNEANMAMLERLRTQNLEMRKEMARLRAKLDLAEMLGNGSGGRGGDDNTRFRERSTDGVREKQHVASDGAMFYDDQAVEFRREGSDTWRPATIDSGRQTIEPLSGRGHDNRRTYVYRVHIDDKEGKRTEDIPEYRIRAAAGGDGDGPGQDSSRFIKNRDGETVVRSRVFGAGDVLLVRDGGSGRSNQGDNKWTTGEVIRRNDNGTYRVAVLGGQTEGKDFHPTMLRARDSPTHSHEVRSDNSNNVPMQSTVSQTSTKPNSPAEEAEIRYAETREKLLALARSALPAPLYVGQEVIAKNGGSSVWGSGIVVGIDDDNRRCSVEFDFGDVEENLPCIFVRPRTGEELATGSDVRPGDPVLVKNTEEQDTRGSDGTDWYAARFGHYDDGDVGYCYVTCAGTNEKSRVQTTRVRPLYPRTWGLGGGGNVRPDDDYTMIPGNPPPPTKPVRAKKHLEGDIVLACIPKAKMWTPAIITGMAGKGRYSVEWADGVREESLLFLFIASMEEPARRGSSAVEVDANDDRETKHSATRSDRSGESINGGNGDRNARVVSTASAKSEATSVKSRTRAASAPAPAAVRLRQRAHQVGDPVLAKREQEQGYWSPGCVTKVVGGGRYDVRFTDGVTVEDLSFLFVRGLSSMQAGGDYGGGQEEALNDRIDNDATDSDHPSARGTEPIVGDQVYVLKRGQVPEMNSQDMHNRHLWRVGTITAAAGGRFTVQYSGEEGKPTETRVIAARIRARNVIRQKAVHVGDAVLALSKVPGRGWVMGAVTARSSGGKYTIAFADGTESDEIRFINLRRVVGYAEKDDHHDKPVRRAIRQRKFKKGELAVTRNPETRKWQVVKIVEVLPSGRYDLEYLGDGSPKAVGVSFQSIRHLDLAHFSPEVNVTMGSDGGVGSERHVRSRSDAGGDAGFPEDSAVGGSMVHKPRKVSEESGDVYIPHENHAYNRSGGGCGDSEEGFGERRRPENELHRRRASSSTYSVDYDGRDGTSRRMREEPTHCQGGAPRRNW